jgi:hypothetical protein
MPRYLDIHFIFFEKGCYFNDFHKDREMGILTPRNAAQRKVNT